MCRGPLAYGHATATRIHCGVRFGEAFLRVDGGLGHLTEDVFVQAESCRGRRRSPQAKDSERARGEPSERQAEKPRPPSIAIAYLLALAAAHLRARASARSHRSGRVSSGRLLRGQRDRPRPRRGSGPRRVSMPPCKRDVRPVPWPCRFGVAEVRPGGNWRGTRSPGSGLRQGRWRDVRRGSRRSCRARRRLKLLHGAGRRLGGSRLGSGLGVGSAGLPGRKQGQRIDISVRLGGEPNSEVEGGDAHFRTGELGRSDHVPLLQRSACAHGDGAQVQERDRIAVLGPQRDRPPAAGNRSCESDHTRNRCEHLLSRRRRDVDAPMLPGPVRVGVDVERPQDRAGDGPAPGRCRGGRRERADGRDQQRTAAASVVSSENHAATVSGPSAVVKNVYSEPR
jgi:hypothetical protein